MFIVCVSNNQINEIQNEYEAGYHNFDDGFLEWIFLLFIFFLFFHDISNLSVFWIEMSLMARGR